MTENPDKSMGAEENTISSPYSTTTGEHNITTRIPLPDNPEYAYEFPLEDVEGIIFLMLVFSSHEGHRHTRLANVRGEQLYPLSALVDEDNVLIVSHPAGTWIDASSIERVVKFEKDRYDD